MLIVSALRVYMIIACPTKNLNCNVKVRLITELYCKGGMESFKRHKCWVMCVGKMLVG